MQAINATLKRTRVIQGDAGELATSTVTSTATGLVATGAFTDSGRQVQIDLAIQLWQEAFDWQQKKNAESGTKKPGTPSNN